MPRPFVVAFASLALLGASQDERPTEANLRAADAEQMRIIVDEDAAAQERFMHPNYMLNAPANVVRRKPELVAALARGDIASEHFERTVEGIALTSSVGIVMGSEIVTPSPASNLGRLHPAKLCADASPMSFCGSEAVGGSWRGRQASSRHSVRLAIVSAFHPFQPIG